MDRVMEIGQREAEETMRALAKVEGIFAGAHYLQKSCRRECIAPCNEQNKLYKEDSLCIEATAPAHYLRMHWDGLSIVRR